jgi:hypothetical protein
MGNDIMHESSMLSMKRRFANVLTNTAKRELFRQPGHVPFVCSVNDDNYEEILSYNELMDYIEKDEQQHQDKDGNGFWNFKHIVGHEGPFRASDPEYKGSRYNVLIEWENGEITSKQGRSSDLHCLCSRAWTT